jgi:hypothetical protein
MAKIIIIDDNSNYNYITNKKLYNTIIINSEYPGRGEFLPYYYYLKNKLFDVAFIIHDSVFIQRYIDLKIDKYKILWEFEHDYDDPENERKIIKLFKNDELLDFYDNTTLWKGCFGAMTIIEYDFLKHIDSKYNINILLVCILNRYDRMLFERVFACLLQKEYKKDVMLGNIHIYIDSTFSYDNYKDINMYEHLPLLKIFTGR